MFKPSVYLSRRRVLLRRMEGQSGAIVFIGNENSPAQCRSNGYKFRQDSNFIYYFGLDVPGLSAVIDLGTGQTTLFGDDDTVDDIIWNGPTPSVRDLADLCAVENTAPSGALATALKGRKVHFPPMSRYENAVKLSEIVGLKPGELFCASKAGCEVASKPLVQAIVAQRLVKSPEEIALLDESCALGQEMHIIARNAIKPGVIEQDIVARMEGFALAKGWGVSFSTILTQHGEIFHCLSHDCRIEEGKLMVVDAGLESNEHYASDFTRTYPTGGKFTTKQKEIYDIVQECNDLAFSMTRPGIAYRDVHLGVCENMLTRLGELGLVSGDPKEMVREGIAGLFMPHGLGHNMGIDDHDMEDLGEDLVGYDPDQKRSSQLGLGSLRMARRLVAGNVISDEPGIYFIPALIEKWKKEGTGKGFVNFEKLEGYYDFGGIRLEDDVLVTENGARLLGKERLPMLSEDVEKAMR